MPDSLISTESLQSIATFAQPAPHPASPWHTVWDNTDHISTRSHDAETAFGLVWGILEDISGLAVEAEKAGDRRLLKLSDELYLLSNTIHDRMVEVRKLSAEMQRLAGQMQDAERAPAPVDTVARLYSELMVAEKAINEATSNPSEEMERALDEATDRFVDEPVTSIQGIALKLQQLAAIESYEKDEPGLLRSRIVFGLIENLAAIRTAQGVVR